jgi:hypothetical protein
MRYWLVGICGMLLVAVANSMVASAQVVAVSPYTVSVFATSVPGQYVQPDSIAAWKNRVFIGYANHSKPDGSGGHSTIVEYLVDGTVLQTYTVKGHNDGLKVNPKTQMLWALQNEDARPNLVIIDPTNGNMTRYGFAKPTHGGGYDDVEFVGNSVFISASNPSGNPNTAQAVVRARLSGTRVVVSPVLLGNANATDVTTGQPVQLNLLDPDSLILNPDGDLVLDSQADAELIILHRAGFTDQSVFHLALTSGGSSVQVDDTVFATSSQGVILVADRDGETIYSIQAPYFGSSEAYSAAPTSVGRVDMHTGVLTPVVTGMVSPHGMKFIATP